MESTSLFTMTPEMFQPILTTITENVGVLLPIGLTIMGIFVAISLVPKIFYRFF